MAGDTTITVIGNLTDDPELRFTPSGAAVAKFRVASTPRFLDRASGEWKDGDPLFLACTVWRQAAENVAESLQRGARVILSGRLRQRSYETREGEKRTVIELEVDEIGPSLRYATAKVQKMSRSGGNGGFGASGGSGFGGGASGGDSGASGSRGGGGGASGAASGAAGGGAAAGGAGAAGGGGYADDPWASAQPAGRGGSGSSFDDEPPF